MSVYRPADAPRWAVDGRDWPNRAASRFVEAGGLDWHVQVAGTGPVLLLLHGTGAATHSWRAVLPRLAARFTVVAPDLPGHGFTAGRPAEGLTLDGMVAALGALLAALELRPALIVGHSAGAAIGLQLAATLAPVPPVVGFSPALLPFPGLGAVLFPSLARVLFTNPLTPRIFAGMARTPGETGRFLARATASRIDDAGVAGYARLLGNHRHCAGVLGMMASWQLEPLAAALPQHGGAVLLVHARDDPAVPLAEVRRAAALLPDCRLELLERGGHLAHEVAPDDAARLVIAFATAQAILAAPARRSRGKRDEQHE